MFAVLDAGLLILLIALTLIVLKLGFLLLLVAGPFFFLIIGTHPGFGRVIAIRWFEILVGVLMKQATIAIALHLAGERVLERAGVAFQGRGQEGLARDEQDDELG